jgi:RluA family pseudouridine synthase
MTHSQKKPFKQPPRKHHPKGLRILYEDHDIVVVDKSNGLLTVSTDDASDNTAYFLLTNYVRRGNSKSRNRVFIVHRLDRDTSGVLVFAKSPQAKQYLQDNWATFTKKYFAVVTGSMPADEGLLESHLAENSALRVYSVHDTQAGKLAKTTYKVLKERRGLSLLDVGLLTGRKHQIRVQLADAGCPIVGDRKYGEAVYGTKKMALHAASMKITHPHTHQPLEFSTDIPKRFETMLKH